MVWVCVVYNQSVISAITSRELLMLVVLTPALNTSCSPAEGVDPENQLLPVPQLLSLPLPVQLLNVWSCAWPADVEARDTPRTSAAAREKSLDRVFEGVLVFVCAIITRAFYFKDPKFQWMD
jgi:hypothetical protein